MRTSLLLACVATSLLGLGCRNPSSPAPQASPEAEQALATGLEKFKTRDRQDLTASVSDFETALQIAPGWHEAEAALANALALSALYSLTPAKPALERADALAQQALEQAPERADVWASAGLARYLGAWDYQGAEQAFLRAIKLGDESGEPFPSANHWYGMMLSALERHEEASAQMSQALELAPSSRIIAIKAATVFMCAGEFERAEEQLQNAQERFGEAALLHRERGYLELHRGDPASAVPHFEKAYALSPQAKTTAVLGYTQGLLGQTAQAQKWLDQLQKEGNAPPLALAHLYLGLDQHEQALTALEQAFEDHDPGLVYLRVRPGFKERATDPRYADLFARLGP